MARPERRRSCVRPGLSERATRSAIESRRLIRHFPSPWATLPHPETAVVHHGKPLSPMSVEGHERPIFEGRAMSACHPKATTKADIRAGCAVALLPGSTMSAFVDALGAKADIRSNSAKMSKMTRSRHSPPSYDALREIYSITSSARPSIGSGMVRPSALAVLRLMISSTFVDCTTGSSAGLSPLRTLPA